MLNNKTIAVLLPAYNEESQIEKVLSTLPGFVDHVVVVNDASTDKTEEVVRRYCEGVDGPFSESKKIEGQPTFVSAGKKYTLIKHLENKKKGTAVANGYSWALEEKIDCTAIMDADGQMDPNELESICSPVVFKGVDYCKGNRLIHKSARLVIPTVRFIGNSGLSLLTKIASGYWKVSDTQTGYTAISLSGIRSLDLSKIYYNYGVPNDILVKLNIAYCTVSEVEIRPIYNVGENSKMNIPKLVPRLAWLLLKLFFYRLYKKYFLRDFHPLFLLYHLGIFLGILTLPFLWKIIQSLAAGDAITFQTLFAFTFFGVVSFQSIVFAMWMDILDNARLYRDS